MDRRFFMMGAAASSVAVSSQVAAQEADVRLRQLYNADMSFSDFAQNMEGKYVSVSGFMAPPLKAETNFYVLTSSPMSVCPFCEGEDDWPADILAVYAQRSVEVIPYNYKIIARGMLELGTHTDPELGFVSRVRLLGAVQERA